MLAREIAFNHLDMMARVFEMTGTFWEDYVADWASPGNHSKRDFSRDGVNRPDSVAG